MNIAVIGAGKVGAAIADVATRSGHTVAVSAAHPEHAQAVAEQTGARAASSNGDAVTDASIVVLAVPFDATPAVADELRDVLAGKVVIDVTNRVNVQDPGAALDGTSAAEMLQERLPGASVVKALNTAFAVRQADPTVDGVALDGFVAGDDDAAKADVMELVGSFGFRPLDAGPLVMSRALESMALLNITMQIRHGWPFQAGWKLVGPTPAE